MSKINQPLTMRFQGLVILNLVLMLSTVIPGLASDTPTPSTWCRFVPERMDDFAWENDLTAFRVYGPGIKASRGGVENSGIDCWPKHVSYPIVDKWYRLDHEQHISYHEEHGEGYDNYHVGKSRGCGGTAVWINGKMCLSGPFKEWKVITRESGKSVFELTYDYDLEGRKIHEVKRITIELGKRLFEAESTFTENGKPADLDIAIGITTHDQKGQCIFNAAEGWMAVWEVIDNFGFGTGVVMDPKRIKEMKELKSPIPVISFRHRLIRLPRSMRFRMQSEPLLTRRFIFPGNMISIWSSTTGKVLTGRTKAAAIAAAARR